MKINIKMKKLENLNQETEKKFNKISFNSSKIDEKLILKKSLLNKNLFLE